MIRRIRPREAEALRAVNSRLPDVPEGGTFGTDRMAKPADWPDSRDSQGFLKRRARFTTDAVYWANPARLGTLFDAAGVPEDAVERFLAVAPELTPSPFSLLHTDVHPGNIPLSLRRNGDRHVVVDWGSATYGDRCTTWPPIWSVRAVGRGAEP